MAVSARHNVGDITANVKHNMSVKQLIYAFFNAYAKLQDAKQVEDRRSDGYNSKTAI